MLTNPSDTLVLDTTRLQVWRQDGDYDYSRELVPSQTSVMEWMSNQIAKLMRSIFGSDFYQQYGDMMWVLLSITALLAIFVFLFYKHLELFGRSGKVKQTDYEVTEDTIYGVDFRQEIEKAMARKDYREVLRLTYLQTLKTLSDSHCIEWQAFKTPTQYTYEYRQADFRKMTNLFVRVRYGGFEATEAMVEEIHNYQQSVDNSVNHLYSKGKNDAKQETVEKGGER